MIEPITINFDRAEKYGQKAKSSSKNQPALMTNLSAGGLSLILFLEPPKAKRLDMILNLPGFINIPIQGKVVRVNARGQIYNVGIAFTKISKKHQAQINTMAQDHLDCETRIGLKLPEACVPVCKFHWLCVKPQKMPHFRRQK
ncbi:MAG: hypothetical protein A3J74_11765 [Elusimicrobia bacterium RIFCSPHIGHO2_02_FULL_57_9]|nr:MAG: hypothetical protein A3J74_11765 [Elusimicrobia bacterium RIFCSPHIGHO2_02_FULL_57_9]